MTAPSRSAGADTPADLGDQPERIYHNAYVLEFAPDGRCRGVPRVLHAPRRRVTSVWREVGDRVWIRRYESLDQTIGAVGGDAGVAVIVTRANHRLADALRDDVRQLPGDVVAVVNTHGHWDHVFGNARFAPLPIWGHVRCVDFIAASGEAARASLIELYPDGGDAFREVVLDAADGGVRGVRHAQAGRPAPRPAPPRARAHRQRRRGRSSRTRTFSSPAICSRTRRRPASATASRSPGPRRDEPCWSWSPGRSCPATAIRSIGPSRSARSASWRRWQSSRARRSAERSAWTRRSVARPFRPTPPVTHSSVHGSNLSE